MALRHTFAHFVERETTRGDQVLIGYLDSATGEYKTDAPGNDGYVFTTYGGIDGYGGVVGIARNFQGAAPKVPAFVRARGGVARVEKNNDSKTATYNPSPNNNYAYTVQKHTHGIGSGNPDPVEANRFVPGLVRPFSEGGSFGLKVYIEATQYEYQNTLTWWASGSLDLTSYVPGTANKQRWVVVGIDPTTNTATAKSDSDYSTVASMNPSQLDGFDFEGNIPLGAVILRNGQTAINTFKDFADLRVFATGNSTAQTPNVKSITANYTALTSDNIIYADTSSSDITVTLYAIADKSFASILIKNTGTGRLTVDANGSEVIENDTDLIMSAGDSATFKSDNTQWWIH
jgi:hypothetical protein